MQCKHLYCCPNAAPGTPSSTSSWLTSFTGQAVMHQNIIINNKLQSNVSIHSVCQCPQTKDAHIEQCANRAKSHNKWERVSDSSSNQAIQFYLSTNRTVMLLNSKLPGTPLPTTLYPISRIESRTFWILPALAQGVYELQYVQPWRSIYSAAGLQT